MKTLHLGKKNLMIGEAAEAEGGDEWAGVAPVWPLSCWQTTWLNDCSWRLLLNEFLNLFDLKATHTHTYTYNHIHTHIRTHTLPAGCKSRALLVCLCDLEQQRKVFDDSEVFLAGAVIWNRRLRSLGYFPEVSAAMTTATKRAKVSLLSFVTGSNVGADSGRSHDKKNKFKIHVTFGSRSRQNEPTLNRKVEQDSLMDQNQNQNQNWNFLLLCIYWFILGHVFLFIMFKFYLIRSGLFTFKINFFNF